METVMGYERYPRDTSLGDYYNSADPEDYGRAGQRGRDYNYSSARDYEAAGVIGPDRGGDRRPYGARDYGHDRYAQRETYGRGQSERYGQQERYGSSERGGYGARGYDRGDHDYRGTYGTGRGGEAGGRHDRDDHARGYGRQPQGYDYEDRGFFQRAGDEVRSWFGDDDAERRREMDSRYDERSYRGNPGGGRHDEDYHSWRSGQIAALDRDYDEYRRENRSRFENEFSSWRTNRQGQRDQLNNVREHQDVVGSDGAHVGTVDKVKGDRILLTKSDPDAGGQHHSIPSSWITSVDDKVTLSKTAAEAKQAWRDEDRNSAMFGYGDNARGRSGTQGDDQSDGKRGLNRSFSGTY
jgi:hypothetical protein